tara:strand:+ start:7359 stop:7586 length:228 start_codon:yes stop_codon:yes gene_type:complete
MSDNSKPHLFLNKTVYDKQKYTGRGLPITKKKPNKNRSEHGQLLLGAIREIWDRNDQRNPNLDFKGGGEYLIFEN